MDLLLVLIVVLCASFFNVSNGADPISPPMCQCACNNRVEIKKDWLPCMTILSLKTNGYVSADEHYAFMPNQERYVFATDKRKLWGTGKWTVVLKESLTYSLKNNYVKEWLHGGTDANARNTYRRYVLTLIKGDKDRPPKDGYWQFIPETSGDKDVYRIRNAFTGEYLFADAEEKHFQRHDFNRVFLWRHVGYYKPNDESFLFKLAKCDKP